MVDNELQKKMDLSVNYGALVMRESEHDYAVVPGSPAEKSGIKERDIILNFNGQNLDHDHPIQDFLEDLKVGQQITLTVLRDGKESSIDVVLSERKAAK